MLFFLLLIKYDILHNVMDFFIILMIVESLSISIRSNLSKRNLKDYVLIGNSFIIINFILIFFKFAYGFYEDSFRFLGMLNSTNVSSSVVCVLSILVWEIEKKIKKKSGTYLLLILLNYIVIIFESKSRSLFLFAPYWMYELSKVLSKKYFILLIIILSLIIIPQITTLVKNLRIGEDGSSITRGLLYMNMWEGIQDNYYLIPHGSNEANLLAKNITQSDEFSPHNDLLRYWFDWGLIFIGIVFIAIRNVKRNLHNAFEFILITIGVMSCALHNLLFLPLIWLPYILIITLKIKKDDCYSSKI